MKRIIFVVLLGSLLVLATGWPLVYSEEQGKKADPAESRKAIEQVVTSFWDNLSQGKAEANLKLCLTEDVTFVGIPGGAGKDKIYQKKVSEIWKAGAGATPCIVDSTQVDLLDDALAVARVRMHTQFGKGRYVFTLTSEGGSWRIVALVGESRLP